MTVKTVNAITTINDMPRDPLLAIFQFLDLKGCLVASRVCKFWTQVMQAPSTMLSQYTLADAQLRDRVTVTPIVSDWQKLPDHWTLIDSSETLYFSSVCHDMISVSVRSRRLSSKFFSFKETIPFTERGIILAQHESTYFLIPQAVETDDALLNGLKPLSSSTLIVKNQNNDHHQTISPLGNLPKNEKNLTSHQIKYCFPFSEDKVAIMIQEGVISFWNLKPSISVCYNKLELPSICSSSVYQIGDYLLVKKQLISLNDLSIKEHEFDFDQYSSVKTCGSFVCAGTKEGLYTLFVLRKAGLLQAKWEYEYGGLKVTKFGSFIRLDLESMSKKFVVLSCRYQFGFVLRIFNMNGALVHSEGWTHTYMCLNPLFAQISDNLLVFKMPDTTTLTFCCICTKAYRSTSALKQLCDRTRVWHGSKDPVQDIRFVDDKLIVLLIREFPMQFRLVQFDPSPSKIMKAINWVSAGVKGAYNKLIDKA